MQCREVCKQYKATGTLSKGKYRLGQRRCSYCDIYLEYEGFWCPCCHSRLRWKRRDKNATKRYHEKKAKVANCNLEWDMHCNGICEKHKPHQKTSLGRYNQGQKRCSYCETYLLWDGIRCPCCNQRLRSKQNHITKNSRGFNERETKRIWAAKTNAETMIPRPLENMQTDSSDVQSVRSF